MSGEAAATIKALMKQNAELIAALKSACHAGDLFKEILETHETVTGQEIGDEDGAIRAGADQLLYETSQFVNGLLE